MKVRVQSCIGIKPDLEKTCVFELAVSNLANNQLISQRGKQKSASLFFAAYLSEVDAWYLILQYFSLQPSIFKVGVKMPRAVQKGRALFTSPVELRPTPAANPP